MNKLLYGKVKFNDYALDTLIHILTVQKKNLNPHGEVQMTRKEIVRMQKVPISYFNFRRIVRKNCYII